MYLELIGFFGIIIMILVILGEQKQPFLGFTGSILLLVMAYWILQGGIQITTGQTKVITQTGTQNALNGTTTLNVTTTENIQSIYTNVPVLPFYELSNLLSLILIFLALYGLYHYVDMWMSV